MCVFAVQLLYNYGARKFALFGVGQIGCSPNELAQNSPDGRTCVQRINSANQIFNSKLKSLVDEFNANNADAKFIYIDSYGIFQDIINSPAAFGNSSIFSLSLCLIFPIINFVLQNVIDPKFLLLKIFSDKARRVVCCINKIASKILNILYNYTLTQTQLIVTSSGKVFVSNYLI